jgi:triacylglycerol esterase/lipase EstA (alpha/beta hydrolase family)
MLIGHSLGGILIKQALVLAHANPANKELIEATFALVFMGTPHDGPAGGSKIAFGKICAKIAKKLYGNDSTDLMEALSKNSLFSDVLEANWRHQLERYQIISCYETIDPVGYMEIILFQHFDTEDY